VELINSPAWVAVPLRIEVDLRAVPYFADVDAALCLSAAIGEAKHGRSVAVGKLNDVLTVIVVALAAKGFRSSPPAPLPSKRERKLVE
jgi:hypothetical protein